MSRGSQPRGAVGSIACWAVHLVAFSEIASAISAGSSIVVAHHRGRNCFVPHRAQATFVPLVAGVIGNDCLQDQQLTSVTGVELIGGRSGRPLLDAFWPRQIWRSPYTIGPQAIT